MSWNNDNSFTRAIQSQIMAEHLSEECKRNGCKDVEELVNKQNDQLENSFKKFTENNNSGRAFFIKDDDVVCTADVSNVEYEPTKVSDVMQEIGNKFSMSFQIEEPSIVDLFQKTLEEDFKPDDILIKQKYSQPLYRERMHPKNVVVTRNKCRIRNRPNSGHNFK